MIGAIVNDRSDMSICKLVFFLWAGTQD